MFKIGRIQKERADLVFCPQEQSVEKQKYDFKQTIEQFSLLKLEESMTIGRSTFLDPDPHISHQHLFIQKKRIVDLSRNGTYVNGARIKEHRLKEGDHIVIGTHSLFYMDPYLISDHPLQHEAELEEKPSESPVFLPKPYQALEIPTFEGLESFPSPIPKTKRSLLQSLAPSLLIFLSTMASATLQVFMEPEKTFSILLSSSSSLLMACSFFGLGLFNLKQTKKEEAENQQQRSDQYKQYIQERTQEYEHAFYTYTKAFMQQKKELKTIQAKKHLPIEIAYMPLLPPALPKLNYQNRQDPLYAYLKEELEQMQHNIPIWKELEFKKAYWINKGSMFELIDHLYALGPENKAMILEKENHYAYLHPLCVDETYLSISSYEAFVKEARSNGNYFILCQDPTRLDPRFLNHENAALIYCGQEESPFVFDHIIKEPYLISSASCRKESKPKETMDHLYRTLLQEIAGQNSAYRFPIGSSNDSLLWMDMEEGHMLIAGTTGSGKSEWVSSLLLYGSTKFAPQDFQYILIDFKGGAFGNAFYDFPHCAGMITNLMKEEMTRFVDSIQAELDQRQKLLADFQKESSQPCTIHAYRKAGYAMSHLWIVVDEFAQLKAKYPETMNDLKEIARIGRSLGIHLILATQKPSGIVDEQIWSNSKYRICLKVNTPADSREVLMHEQAAQLNKAGEFIFQEGNGETEDQGMGFYIHQSANCLKDWHFLDEKEDQSVLDFLKEKILERKEKRRWILQPSLTQFSDFDMWLIDQPERQNVLSYCPQVKERTLILSDEKERLMEKAYFSKDPIYILAKNFTLSSLYFLLKEKQEKVVVLDLDQMPLDYLPFFDQPNICLFALCSKISMHLEERLAFFDHKICTSSTDRDSMRLLLQSYCERRKEFPMGYLRRGNALHSMRWKEQSSPALLAKPYPQIDEYFTLEQACNYFNNFVLGYDLHFMPILWSRKNQLLIAYEQKRKEEDLYYLLQLFQRLDPLLNIQINTYSKEADIVLMQVQESKDLLQRNDWKERLYEMDLCWFGANFNEYAYLFQKKMVYEPYEILYFHQDQIQIGEGLKFDA